MVRLRRGHVVREHELQWSTPRAHLDTDPSRCRAKRRQFRDQWFAGDRVSTHAWGGPGEDRDLPASRCVANDAVFGRAFRRWEGIRFLYVGRLIPQKRPVELIRAFETASDELPAATLTVVGQGELESEVREAAARVPGVRYIGFCEGEELDCLYSESDVLVLPALREVWGLVVNEALAHGLFVIATDEVGSAHDLLNEWSGIMLPANDLQRLSAALIETARTLDLSDAARLRRAAAISDCTPERFAADISKAADMAVQLKRAPDAGGGVALADWVSRTGSSGDHRLGAVTGG